MNMEKMSQEELEKARGKYEKQAGEIANKGKTLWERITGKGISKKQVMETDAHLENEVRDESKEKIEQVKAWKDDRQDYVEAVIKGYEEPVEKMAKSNLQIEERLGKGANIVNIMSGLINGQEVSISYTLGVGYEGTLNGKQLPEDEAAKIFHEYKETAEKRTSAIEETRELQERKEHDEEEAKRLESVRGELKKL